MKPTASPADPGGVPRGGSIGRRPLVLVAIAVVAIVAVALLRTRGGGPSEPQSPITRAADQVTLDAAARQAAGITVEPARTIARTDPLEANAVLALDETRTARIGAIVDGIVMATTAEIGDQVPRGKALASLMSEVVHEAWAAYRKALSEQRRATNELTYAKQAEARATRLLGDKAISAQELQRATADRSAAEEQLDMANTEVRRAEEALEHLGITNKEDPTGEQGEEIPARTPIGGTVLERLVTTGTAVTPGTLLFVVSDLSRLWALAEIDESRLSAVKVGRAVALRVSAYPDEEFRASITFVGDMVNPKTRRVTVRCEVPNADRRLKPEMFATVSLGAGEPHTVVAVPSSAVHEINGQTVVFVQEPSGTFRQRKVATGPEVEGQVEVRSGLRAGERVATTGSFLLKSELLKSATPEG